MDWDDMALVGRIARPHGLRGQVVINPETDFVEERFAEGATVWTRSVAGDEQLTVASLRVQNGRPVVGFEGFTRVEDVERLAGGDADHLFDQIDGKWGSVEGYLAQTLGIGPAELAKLRALYLE